MKDPNQEGAIPFVDTLASSGPNNTLITTVYKKPTHTDQYLYWDSNHFISAKNSVFNTLAFRARVVCSNLQTLQQENEHIRKTLLACNFLQAPNSLLINLTTGTTSTVYRQLTVTNITTPT